MILAIFGWKKFSCASGASFAWCVPTIFFFFFCFVFYDFFDSCDGFRQKEGTARGLLSISTLREF